MAHESLDQIAESLAREGKLNVGGAPASPSPSPPVAGTRAAEAYKQQDTTDASATTDPQPDGFGVKEKLAGAGVVDVSRRHADDRLNAILSDKAYLDASDPRHGEVVAAAQARFKELHGEGPDPMNPSNPLTLYDARKAFKVEFHPDALPTEELRAAWNTADEADFLSAARDWNLNSSTVQALYEFVQDTVILAGGPDKVDRAAAVKAFEERFARDLTADQQRRLVAWWFSNEDDAPTASNTHATEPDRVPRGNATP
jgi:hypothetical protein